MQSAALQVPMTAPSFSRRTWLKTAGATAGGSLLAGCGGDESADTPTNTPPESVPDATFVTAEFNTIYNNNFNPYDNLFYPNQSTMGYLFGTLVAYAGPEEPSIPDDREEAIQLLRDNLVPELATDMRRDGSTVTLDIDDRFTWHDGTPVTAQDVVAKYELDRIVGHRRWRRAFHSVHAPDDTTLVIEVAPGTNDFALTDMLVTTIVDVHPDTYAEFIPPYEEADRFQDLPQFEKTRLRGKLFSMQVTAPFGQGDQEENVEEVIGWGPWRLAERTDSTMRFERYDAHPYADRINFPEVRFDEYVDNQARYQALLADDFCGIDLVLTQAIWNELPNHYRKYTYNRRLGIGWAFNYERDWFKDYRVRQAFAYAMDKNQIVANSGVAAELITAHEFDSAFYARRELHDQFLGEGFVDELVQYDQDTEKAASLLREVGWSRDDGQWYDDSDEAVQLLINVPPTWPEWVNMAQTAAQHLSDFGIDAELQTQELVIYYGQTMLQTDYDIAAWWCGGARGYPWYGLRTIWEGLEAVTDDHAHPDEYDVPMPIGDPDGELERVNVQSLLTELAQTRMGPDRPGLQKLTWTYNQMLPVYCMNENTGLAVLDGSKWTAPDDDHQLSNAFFPLNEFQNRGLIKALE